MVKSILFVCTKNSARSQMAEGFFNFYNKNPRYIGISAGTHPAKSVNPNVIKVMKEKGIDISEQKTKALAWDAAKNAHKIYTMGCTQGCPITPPEKTEDWNLENPAGKSIEKFREVRDDIERRIKKLVSGLG